MLRMAHATHPEDITGLALLFAWPMVMRRDPCLFPTATHAKLFAAAFIQHITPDRSHSAQQNTDGLGTGLSYLNSEQANC